MRHLKIYEDYGFERPTVHADDELFDTLINELGSEIDTPVGRVDDNNKDAWNRWHYWLRNESSNGDKTFITWTYRDKIKLKNWDEDKNWDDKSTTEKEISIVKTSITPQSITSRPGKDKYHFNVGDHWGDTLDVSEEKLINFFNKLELKFKLAEKERKLKIAAHKKIATFDALKKREEVRISKASQPFGI
jgi:hypothetical protein